MKKIMSFLSGRLRVKIFAALIAVLTVFFILIASMSEPLLFYVFTRNTYATLSDIAGEIDRLISIQRRVESRPEIKRMTWL